MIQEVEAVYHVALDVTQEQKHELRMLATSRKQSVQEFMTNIVLRELEKSRGYYNEKEEVKK